MPNRPENIHTSQPETLKSSGLMYLLLHGSFQDDWSMHRLEPEIKKLGHDALSIVLPFDKKNANYETWADVAAEHIDDPSTTIPVLTSRSCNIGELVAKRKTVPQIILTCPGFDPSNGDALRRLFRRKLPDKYNPKFLEGITEDTASGMATLGPDVALDVLFHDCPPDLAEEALEHLRPMYRAVSQPAITEWTDTPAAFIYATEDRVINEKYAKYISKSKVLARKLGERVFKLQSGHSPYLSQPAELARKINDATIF